MQVNCVLSTSLSAPIILKQRLKSFGNYCGKFCTEDWGNDHNGRRVYGSIMLSVQFLVPLIIITFCYTAISFKLGKQRAAVKRRQRTNRMLIGMVVAFSASWFTSVLFNVLRDYDRLPAWFRAQEYFFGIATHCIAMSSTIWNPLLYAALNLQLRAAFLRLLPDCVRLGNSRSSTLNDKPLLPHSKSGNRNGRSRTTESDERRRQVQFFMHFYVN
ncbi:unnamed protein product [Gongylonema pulchrum]|uniref:G-protein coupled receptors family 1 profile domain-containing protein n=1 Tax=Gongylonema pulchrum TaxID=637853 RepID=A0A3P6R712_9BILA|nr:unnamed protein product [Gongylonema pulchrum]